MEVLHLDYRPPTAAWVLPLQSRLVGSSSQVLRLRYARWAEVGLAELGIAVATRLTIAFVVARRLQALLKTLRDEIAASGDLDSLLEGGYVYTPQDQWISYEICAAFDAVIFEYRSSYEVLGRFIRSFGTHILGREVTEDELNHVLLDAGLDLTWVEDLRLNRILFFHKTAPWIALRVNHHDPLEVSLIVMKRNLSSFDDPNDYVVQPQLVETIAGFQQASWRLRDWLAAQVGATEEQLRSSGA